MKEENVKSEYQRKVDKSLIPTCNIMGVNIAAINMNWLLKYIDENLSDIKGDYIISAVRKIFPLCISQYSLIGHCFFAYYGL